MPLTNPFSVKNCFSLFEIRLDSDFVVFRGGEDESAGQLLRGVVVLCLSAPLRVEEVRLRLSGNLRLVWAEWKPNIADAASQRVDRTMSILEHRWPAFVGGPNARSTVLPEGNYEWPFEFTLPGNTAESIEGIPEASITYRLKATIARGKLSHDLHAHRHLRVIRTLEPGALELLHAMSVENTWPNKVDYSIVMPQKAVVFGTSVTLAMRFTPLLKGLELGRVVARLVEARDCAAASPTGGNPRQHRVEREVTTWRFDVCQDHWRDAVDATGQDGWVLTKKLPLPNKLRQCVQDLSHHGIKVRHKLKLTVALKNPDGHISELRAMLPISIFISPDMPPDEQGNLVIQPSSGSAEAGIDGVCPPGYGAHILDQLYDERDSIVPLSPHGPLTPVRSRAASDEQIPRIDIVNDDNNDDYILNTMSATTPPALATSSSNHLSPPSDSHQSPSLQRSAAPTINSGSNGSPPTTAAAPAPKPQISRSGSLLSRSGSRLSRSRSRLSRGGSRDQPSPTSSTFGANAAGRSETLEHVEDPATGQPGHSGSAALSDLNQVPSYAMAVKTPANRRRICSGGVPLPDYQAALGNRSNTRSGRQSLNEERLAPSQALRVPRSSRPRPTSVTSLLVHGLHLGSEEGGTDQGRGWHALSHVRERIF